MPPAGRGRGRLRPSDSGTSTNDSSPSSLVACARDSPPPRLRANFPGISDEREKSDEDARSVESGIDCRDVSASPLPLGSTMIARRPSAPAIVYRRGTGPMQLKSNMRTVIASEHLKLHQYELVISRPGRHKADILSKGSRDDYRLNRNREKCYQIFTQLVKDYPAIFNSEITFNYDRCKYLLTDKRIPGLGSKKQTMEVTIYDFESMVKEDWQVQITPSKGIGVGLHDLSCMHDPDLNRRDYEPKKMVEVMTSQSLFKQWNDDRAMKKPGRVLVMQNKAYDMTRQKIVPNAGAVIMAPGFVKTAKLTMSGPNNTPALALVVDKKDRAFYAPVTIEEFCRMERINIDLKNPTRGALQQLNEKINGKTIKTTHGGEVRSFVCTGLMSGYNKNNCSNHIIRLQDNRQLSVEHYFLEKYKITLKYPMMPGLRNAKHSVFPIEVCQVAEYQGVPVMKQTPALQQYMIKEGALAPAARFATVEQMLDFLSVETKSNLARMGMQIAKNTMIVGGRLLPLPMINMQQKRMQVDQYGEYKYNRGKQFLVGGGCRKVGLLVIPPFDNTFNSAMVAKWYQTTIQMACKMGIQMPKANPAYYAENVNFNDIEGHFLTMAQQGIDFVLTILPDNQGDQYHMLVKFSELKTEIVTQNVRKMNVLKMIGDRGENILYNVLAKTNVKLGGVDHEICFDESTKCAEKWFAEDVMYIGMDINHMSINTRAEEPSVVGLVANAGKGMFSLIGEHYIIPPKTENQDEDTWLDEYITSMVVRWAAIRKRLPKYVIFLRDGTSYGQFVHIMQVEIPLVRKALKDAAQQLAASAPALRQQMDEYEPLINMIICRKDHNELFGQMNINPRDKVRDQNVKPGTLIDEAFNPTDIEFHMAAHSSNQGTTRMPKFTVLLNECGMSMDALYNTVHLLCYGHQCVSKPVSLPAPVFGAHNMAKRGKLIFTAYEQSCASDTEASGSMSSLRSVDDYRHINEVINIRSKSKLSKVFFNQ